MTFSIFVLVPVSAQDYHTKPDSEAGGWYGLRTYTRNDIKRLLHDIFHIGPGINPRLPYHQARQRSWSADIGRGLIPGNIWKISCHYIYLSHILHWLFPSIDFYIADNIFELTNCENKSLRELPLFNLQIFLFQVWFQKYTKQCWSVQWR
jgi:hypothetical protein